MPRAWLAGWDMLDMVNRAEMTLSPLLRLGRSCGSDQKCIGAAYPLQTSQAGEERFSER
jgi:hypothetical protein